VKKFLISVLSFVFILSLFQVPETKAATINYVDAEVYADIYGNSEHGLKGFIINRGNRILIVKSADIKISDANNNIMLNKSYSFGEIELSPGEYHYFDLKAPELQDRQFEMAKLEYRINHIQGITPVNKSGTFVYVNGKKISPDVAPAIINSRVLVPMRSIFEALGATVSWDSTTNMITSYKEDINVTIKHKIGQNYMLVNGQKVTLDVSSQSIKGRTMVPVRAIANAFFVNVEYVRQDNVNYITVMDLYSLARK
jgi:hypothetical protein